MSFDKNKYMNARYENRIVEVPVKGLDEYFGKDDPKVFKVRQLNGFEVGAAKMAVKKNRNREALLAALERDGVSIEDRINSINEFLKMGKTFKADDIVERIEYLVLGSVDPVVDLEFALKLCKTHPFTFFDITTTIMNTTGLGMMPGKP